MTAIFAGKHDVSVQKVGEGVECEAGWAEDSEVEKSDKVTVIEGTMVPGAPIVVSDALPKELVSQISGLLAQVTADEMVEAGIESASSDAFRSVFFETTPVDDAYYDTVRDICETTKASQCQG